MTRHILGIDRLLPPTGFLVSAIAGGAQARSQSPASQTDLVPACNPETGPPLPWSHPATDGIISWTYDSAGRPQTRTEGAGTAAGGTATLSFAYNDPLGQLTSKTYSDSVTPSVTFAFNYANCSTTHSCGRLASLTSTGGAQPSITRNILSYDAFGNVLGVQQQIGSGTVYQITHSRNLVGALTKTILPPPTSREIDYSYDEAGRVQSVVGYQNNKQTTYASNLQYAPHGAIESMSLGPVLTETTAFNSNLQPVSITAGSLLSLGYTYCSMIGTGGVCSSGDDNGNVKTQTITRSGQTWNQSYSYDPVNRLSVAREAGPGSTSWEQTFGYDYAGNRWLAANASGDPLQPYTPSNETPQSSSWYLASGQSNNQITASGWIYDNAGNILAVGGTARTFTYDAENRQITATVNGIQEDYTYDGEGRRVMKQDDATHAATIYVYDADGQLAVEYPATPPTTGGTEFLTADSLGSTRLVTDVNGNVIQCNDYLPFGEDLTAGGRTCVSTVDAMAEKKFTSKERDTESGLDFFGARYFSSGEGRWTSPDWSTKPQAVPYTDLGNPQTFNLYGYVSNNPVSKADTDGHCYPICTVLIGAAVGAVAGAGAEYIGEKLKGEKVDVGKIRHAAAGGALAGAITGLAGPEAGVLAKFGTSIGGQLLGGAVERGMNGEKVFDGKEVLKDAAAGAFGTKIEGSAEKTFASTFLKKTVPAVAEIVIDAGRRGETTSENRPEPVPAPAPVKRTVSSRHDLVPNN